MAKAPEAAERRGGAPVRRSSPSKRRLQHYKAAAEQAQLPLFEGEGKKRARRRRRSSGLPDTPTARSKGKIPAGGLAHKGALPVRRSTPTQRRLLKVQAAAEAKGQMGVDLDEGKRQQVHTELARIGQLGEGLPAGATIELLERVPWERSPRLQWAVLRFPDGMSHEEIGFVLGCLKQTVQKVEARALNKLAEAFGLTPEDVRDLLRSADERARGRVHIPQ